MATYTGKAPILGEAARTWLSQCRSGKVIASVSQAVYLLSEQQKLVWLEGLQSPLHCRCIQWPRRLPTVEVDSAFAIKDQSILFESGLVLDLGDSHTWAAPSLTVSDVIEIDRLPDRLFTNYEKILSLTVPIGFGAFIAPILQIAKGTRSPVAFRPEDLPTRVAWPIVESITVACLAQDLRFVLQQAEALFGLGEGLTPSGDDFLGGMLFARHLLSRYYPHLLFLKLPNPSEWIASHQQRTNLISYTLLKDNTNGHALEPLQHFGTLLLSAKQAAVIIPVAMDLVKVGHSTGWSLLAGFLSGILLAFADNFSISH